MTDAEKFNQDEKIEILERIIACELNLLEAANMAKKKEAYSLMAMLHDTRSRLLIERFTLLKDNTHIYKLLPQKTQLALETINAHHAKENR